MQIILQSSGGLAMNCSSCGRLFLKCEHQNVSFSTGERRLGYVFGVRFVREVPDIPRDLEYGSSHNTVAVYPYTPVDAVHSQESVSTDLYLFPIAISARDMYSRYI